MPTHLPQRSLPGPPPSQREIAAILIGYVVALSVFAGVVAFDIRVAAWVASAAQAVFTNSESLGISEPIQRAERPTTAG